MRGARQRDRGGELPAGQSRDRVGRQRRRVGVDPGLRHEHRASTRARRSRSRSTRPRRTTGSTSTGWATTAGRARARSRRSSRRRPAAEPAGLPDDGGDGPDRLRQLGRVGELGGPGRRGLRHLPRQARARGRDGRVEPHGLRRARRRRRLRAAVPDLRHDLAGLQPATAATRLYTGSPAGRAYKVSYNRPVHHARLRAGGLGVQRRVPDGPLAGAQRLRHLLHHGRRRRPLPAPSCSSTRRSCPSATTSTGRATQRANVEAARAAGVNLAFFSGNEVFWKTRWEQHRQPASAPHARHLQGDAREREDRPRADDWTGTWRDPRFSPPADGGRPENALTGQLFQVNDGATTAIQVPAADGKMRFWRNTTIATQAAGATATLPERDARLRVGRGHRQRVPARRVVPALVDDGQQRAGADRLRLELRQPAPSPTT